MERIIKRYENRKLYDTQASAYVSLAGLADLVRSGTTVSVVDNVTGEDLTVQTLTQVILEEGKQGRGTLSPDLLHGLLRRGSEALETGVSSIRHGVDDLVQQSVRRVQTFLSRPEPEELQQLRSQLGRLEDLLVRMLENDKPKEAEPPPESTREGDPRHD